MEKRCQEIDDLTPEVREVQEKILSNYGRNIGEKTRNYIFNEYYFMEMQKLNARELVSRWRADVCISERVSTKMINGKGLSKKSLLKMAIGNMWRLAEALAIFDLYGFSLKGPNDEYVWNILKKIENDDFEEFDADDRMIECGLATEDELDKIR